MTRRERRELAQRAARQAQQAASGDTVVVGGITFHGPAPVSPAVGTPQVTRARSGGAADTGRPSVESRVREEPRVREEALVRERGAQHPAEQDVERARAEHRHLAERQQRAQQYRSAQELRARREREVEEVRAHEMRRAQERRAQETARALELRRAEREHREQMRRADEERRARQRLEQERREQERLERLRRDQERLEALRHAAHPTPERAAAPAPAPEAVAPIAGPAAEAVASAVEPSSVVGPAGPEAAAPEAAGPEAAGPEAAAPEAAAPEVVATRAARAGRAEPQAERGHRHRAWLPRVAVLGALAAATIAVPVAPGAGDAESPFDLDLAPSGPSTLDVLSGPAARPAVAAGIAAEPVLVRDLGVSRSQERDPLPGCDATTGLASTNGKLTEAELCTLPFAQDYRLSARAAVALTALNEAFRAEFGVDITLVSGYRTIGQQYAVKESRGYLAAKPGTSMHGYGLAIDLSSAVTGNSRAYKWLVANGAAYGWENPPWARRGGSGKYEPWHFEFRPGVEEISTWH